MDLDDMAGGIREIGRVLEPGGCLCICVLHPMAAAGHFDTREPDSPFTIANTSATNATWKSEPTMRDRPGRWARPAVAFVSCSRRPACR